MQPRSTERLQAIDAIRGLAAMAVVTMHYSMTYNNVISPESPLSWSNPFGGLGVHVFFAISGFVILLTLDRSPSARRFAIGRFARLYPAFWASAGLTWLMITIGECERYAIDHKSALLNGTMLAGFLGHRHIDPVYWTLEAELQFYALMAVIIALGARRQVVHVLLALVVLDLANVFLQFTEWDGTGLWRLRVYLPLNRIYLFLFGVVLFDSRSGWRVRHGLAAAVCMMSLLLYNPPVRAGIVGVSLLLLYAATRGRARWIAVPPLLFLGTISYSLYLIHQISGYIVLEWLHDQGLPGNIAVAFTIALAVLAATGLTYAIERPCHRLIRSRIGNAGGHPAKGRRPAGAES